MSGALLGDTLPASAALYLLVLFFASLAVLVAACYELDNRGWDSDDLEDDWALACAAISVLLVGGCTLLCKFKPAGAARPVGLVSILLTIWWMFGVGVLTFDRPFRHVGNGFFGSWLALGAACALACVMSPGLGLALGKRVVALPGGRALGVVLVASIVVVAQLMTDCGGWCTNNDHGHVIALLIGCVSCILSLVYLGCTDALVKFRRIIAMVFLSLWCAGGRGVGQSVGGARICLPHKLPFLGTGRFTAHFFLTFHNNDFGNKYFSCWCASFGAVWFAADAGL
jgi:hypothetical protein